MSQPAHSPSQPSHEGTVDATANDMREKDSELMPATWWSGLMRAGQQDIAALEKLCATYRQPLLILAKYYSVGHRDAEDFVQSFMSKIFSPAILSEMDREEGRFRNFLKTCLKRHIRDEKAKIRTDRYQSIEHDQEGANSPPDEPADTESRSPEEEFERAFAMRVFEKALVMLSQKYKDRDQERRFEVLKPLLTGKQSDLSQDQAAEILGMTRSAVGKAVFDMRKEFKIIFRKEVSQLVKSVDEIDDEITALMNALSK